MGDFTDAGIGEALLALSRSATPGDPDAQEEAMPHVSRDTADESISVLGLDVRLTNFDGGYTVCFESHSSDQDLGPLFEGLPNDECQFPRLGYVLAGSIEFRIGDRSETYTTGEAYYVPPGHVPIHRDGTQIVEFSPTEPLGQTIGVVMANLDRGRRPVQFAAGRSPR